jgi:hypothetical protein
MRPKGEEKKGTPYFTREWHGCPRVIWRVSGPFKIRSSLQGRRRKYWPEHGGSRIPKTFRLYPGQQAGFIGMRWRRSQFALTGQQAAFPSGSSRSLFGQRATGHMALCAVPRNKSLAAALYICIFQLLRVGWLMQEPLPITLQVRACCHGPVGCMHR